MMESFCKNSYLAHFLASALKIVPIKNFLENPLWKNFLYFLKKAPNFLETETPPKILMSQETKLSYISK